MDKNEKRRLKKLGKQIVAEQSRQLRDHLNEANPAPVGSDEWAKGYKKGTLKEKALRAKPPDRLSAIEVEGDFVPNPATQNLPVELFGVPGCFWQCLNCGDLINSLPRARTSCVCGNILVEVKERRRVFQKPTCVRLVGLIGKA